MECWSSPDPNIAPMTPSSFSAITGRERISLCEGRMKTQFCLRIKTAAFAVFGENKFELDLT